METELPVIQPSLSASHHDFDTEEHDTFRNQLASIAADGRRKWVYARKPEGRYYNARTIVSYFLLIFFFSASSIKIHGNQFLLFNILERKFVLFGFVFWPQDFYLLVLSLLTVILGIAVVTSLWGRVWCGWACPQTIFLEMLFRKIEYAIEGNAKEQIVLDKAPLTPQKFFKKALKHSIFYALSFLIGNLFLSYIIGRDELFTIISEPPQQHLVGLSSMVLFSFVFYGVFARFREQACLVACPYGRFMSALVDNQTVTVTYDQKRGEPRKKFSRADKLGLETEEKRGDCIDCHQCVTVCPTGIDIRNGIQLECVACTACIDACDQVMTKIHKPTGLIRYTSAKEVAEGVSQKVPFRTKAYMTVFALLFTVVSTLYYIRPSTELLVLRQPGTLFSEMPNNKVANFFKIQVINKSFDAKPLEIKVTEPAGATVTYLGEGITTINGQQYKEAKAIITVDKSSLTSGEATIKVAAFSQGQMLKESTTRFVGPAK